MQPGKQRKPSRPQCHSGNPCPETGVWRARVQLPKEERLGLFDPRIRYFSTGKILPDFRGRAVVWRLDVHDSELSPRDRQWAMDCYNDQYQSFRETEGQLYNQYTVAVHGPSEQAERDRLTADFKTARDARWDQFRRQIRVIKPWQ